MIGVAFVALCEAACGHARVGMMVAADAALRAAAQQLTSGNSTAHELYKYAERVVDSRRSKGRVPGWKTLPVFSDRWLILSALGRGVRANGRHLHINFVVGFSSEGSTV